MRFPDFQQFFFFHFLKIIISFASRCRAASVSGSVPWAEPPGASPRICCRLSDRHIDFSPALTGLLPSSTAARLPRPCGACPVPTRGQPRGAEPGRGRAPAARCSSPCCMECVVWSRRAPEGLGCKGPKDHPVQPPPRAGHLALPVIPPDTVLQEPRALQSEVHVQGQPLSSAAVGEVLAACRTPRHTAASLFAGVAAPSRGSVLQEQGLLPLQAL